MNPKKKTKTIKRQKEKRVVQLIKIKKKKKILKTKVLIK